MAVKLISKEHHEEIYKLFNEVNESVKIITPFIKKSMAKVFASCKEQNPNLETKLITRFYREDFIQGSSDIEALEIISKSGVEIYVLKDLHAKLYLFDSDKALIGSANFTTGGFKMNHELSLLITDEPEVNPILVSHFDELVNDIVIQSSEFLLSIDKILDEKAIVEADIKKRAKNRAVKHTSTMRFGANLPTMDKTLEKEEQDIIQTILTKPIDKEYNETIWIKFEGSSKSRFPMDSRFVPVSTKQFPGGVTFFGRTKKPSKVKEGDYVFIAVLCESDLPYIVGRGRSIGYNKDNIATPEMIQEHEWMSHWPHYYGFSEFEYIDAPISGCIPMREVLKELGSFFLSQQLVSILHMKSLGVVMLNRHT